MSKRVLCAAVLCLCLSQLYAFAGVFGPPVAYPVGPLPCQVATGDFNNDGNLDLVVGNSAGGIRTLLGNGDGTFQPGVLTRTPHPRHGASCAASWQVGDFNRDGNLDIVVPYSSGQIQTLLGNGDGTFTITGNSSRFTTVSAVGDFNEDGIPDILLVSPGGYCGGVVYQGNGDGTFLKNTQIFVGHGCLLGGPFAVGDFNADGHQDVLIASTGEGIVIEYYVAFGKGDGTFRAALVQSTQNNDANRFVVSDLNGDGIADLAFASGSQGDVGVQLGVGDGTFPINFPSYCNTGNTTEEIHLADLNGDGILDVAFHTNFMDNFYIGPGQTSGSFGPCNLLDVGPSPGAFAFGDFNGDGAPDLAVANYISGGTVSVLLNTHAPGTSKRP